MATMTVVTVLPPTHAALPEVGRALARLLDPEIAILLSTRLALGGSGSFVVPTAALWNVTGLLAGAGATTLSKPVATC